MSDEYFQKVYEADAENQKVQKLTDYLAWATGKEGLAATMWKKLTEELPTGLDEDAAQWLRERLVVLGRRAIGEWAKDNTVRAFDTMKLEQWARSLRKAKELDSGRGQSLSDAMDEMERDLDWLIVGRDLPVL